MAASRVRRRLLTTEIVTIDAPPEEHDRILLDRVAGWAAAGPVSFLRVNKPVWRLEVTRHDRGALSPDAADSVADSALVLHILASERDMRAPRSRRELLLRSMRRVAEGLDLSRDECLSLHGGGYRWALDLGRWDHDGMAALERKFLTQLDGLTALRAIPCDPESEARWRLLTRPPGSSESAVLLARRVIGHHANRLGVFAEAEAILHYLLFRLDSLPDEA